MKPLHNPSTQMHLPHQSRERRSRVAATSCELHVKYPTHTKAARTRPDRMVKVKVRLLNIWNRKTGFFFLKCAGKGLAAGVRVDVDRKVCVCVWGGG